MVGQNPTCSVPKKNSEMLGSERKGRNCIRKGLGVEGRSLWKTSPLGRKQVHVLTHLLCSKHIARPDKVQQEKKQSDTAKFMDQKQDRTPEEWSTWSGWPLSLGTSKC